MGSPCISSFSSGPCKLKERNLTDRPFTLEVPGGLAGQLFAVSYAAWIASRRQEEAHIRFFDAGTGISQLGVQGVLNSELCQKLGITFSVVKESWPPASSHSPIAKVRDSLTKLQPVSFFELVHSVTLGGFLASREWLDGRKSSWGLATPTSISREKLLRAPAGSTIAGFPTDYRVIEESWSLLAKMIKSSGSPDFAHNTGVEDTVSVQWRLGDYVGNPFHGAVGWDSIRNCLKYANPEGLPVRVFTDSPDLAQKTIREVSNDSDFEILSGDIWSDLFGMTRSRVFIGSQSGVSFLAALALRSDNPDSATWLPDKWFLNSEAQLLFNQGPVTAEGSALYPAKLVTSAIPA